MLVIQRLQLPDGQQVFDLALATGAQDWAAAHAASAIYALLFTDQKAPEGRVQDGRRGWWANPADGSGLWYVRRQALDSAARRESVQMVQRALDGRSALSAVVVEDVSVPGSAGSVSTVDIKVSGSHNGQAFSIALSL